MELTDSFVQQKLYHELGLKTDEINLEIFKFVSEFLDHNFWVNCLRAAWNIVRIEY